MSRMKLIFIIACIFYLWAGSVFGQVRDVELSVKEEKEAKTLAVSFYTRFQQTQDVTPLIKEYFIKDFASRLKYCYITGECGGFARDFWGKADDKLLALNPAEEDFQRVYSNSINNFFLLFQLVSDSDEKQTLKDSDLQTSGENLKKEIAEVTKDNPTLMQFMLFPDQSDYKNSFEYKTLKDYRQYLDDYEKYISVLRTLRTKNLRKNGTQKLFFSSRILPKQFEISVEKSTSRFFNYDGETKMLRVWNKDISLPFVMDLIREDGKLKIIAIYVPMD